MITLFACIADMADAAAVQAAGFDGVVLKDSGAGDAGDVPAGLKPGWLDLAAGQLVVGAVAQRQRFRVWAAPFAPEVPQAAAAAGEAGVLMWTAGRLLDAASLATLAAAIESARERGLAVALAGAIEPPDVPRLLALAPTMLLIGRALRAGGQPDAPLEPERLATMRALVPRGASPSRRPRLMTPRGDRIFVRDLLLSLDIGAYASESGRRQRVRFSVEAELAAADRPAETMGDIVSYDLIADAVTRVAERRRVAFVETLAEAIAADLLSVPRIVEVQVRVEKLDLGAGAVGVEIVRRRYDEA